MLDNKSLLNKKEFLKGMLALPDIVLTPEEADKFIDYVVDESFWADNVRIVKMNKKLWSFLLNERMKNIGLYNPLCSLYNPQDPKSLL